METVLFEEVYFNATTGYWMGLRQDLAAEMIRSSVLGGEKREAQLSQTSAGLHSHLEFGMSDQGGAYGKT